jgi:2-oxoacid:acceptor oxidoreductase delta subunit (pyruvate/2-ketoisovalerate family)
MTKENAFDIRKPPAELTQSQQPIQLEALEDYPYKSVALGSTRANLTGLWRYWRPYYQTKRAPCDANCPVGNQVVDYIQTLLEGHWQEAANVLRNENPLPAITGRICHRPCEINCNRRQYDKRIAIHSIEAVLAEVPHETLQFPAIEEPRTVAVVGSGPAELAFAHFMALLHHRVTLFEPADALGGRLRHGPQARHLPPGLLDAEIDRLLSDRIEVRRRSVKLADLAPDFDVVFGVFEDPEHLTLHVSDANDAAANRGVKFLKPLRDGEGHQDPVIEIPLRVSEAIGYGKWSALLLDSNWRGLNPQDTLAHIQMGGNNRIVSAMKYLQLLSGREIQRSEEIVTYDKLHLELLDPPRPLEPDDVAHGQRFVTTDFASTDDIELVIAEAARCFSCGRCNDCDNCWIYCPDIAISRDTGAYEIDYDYCKGCTLCAAVCPRGVISVIEEEKWSE